MNYIYKIYIKLLLLKCFMCARADERGKDEKRREEKNILIQYSNW